MLETAVIAISIAIGTLARLYMLRIDYRMYPSYPQGYLIHLTFGAIAAALGAVAIPAILAKDYQAVTFLALAATQFREVRSVERETLQNMESTELVPRGAAYIEGIARVFEARNYLALLAALISSLVAHSLPFSLGWRLLGASAIGLATPVVLRGAMQGARVADIADIKEAPIDFEGPMLTVGGLRMMNIGLPAARQVYRERGIGIVLIPKNPDAKATLANTGQCQAVAHDAAGQLGIYMATDEPEFTPVARRDSATGNVVLVIIPAEHNPEALKIAVGSVPVLEGVRRHPLSSRAGQIAD